MKNLLLSAILVYLLFSTAYAISPSQANNYFNTGGWNEAHWSKSNPNIYHFLNIEIWNTNVMHSSIETLSMEKIDISAIANEKAKLALQDAISEKALADISKSQCDMLYKTAVGELPAESIGTAIFEPTSFLFKVFKLMAAEIKNKSFTECGNYGKHWIATMNNARLAFQVSFETENSAYKNAGQDLAKATLAGLCDDDFNGPSKQMCKEAGFNMEVLKGEHSKITEFSDHYYLEAKKATPNLTGYDYNIQTIWSSALAHAEKAEDGAKNATDAAMKDYQMAKIAVDFEMAGARQKAKNLENQQVQKIGESAYSSESPGTANETYEEIMNRIENGDKYYVNATELIALTSPGYLKNGILQLKTAYENYMQASADSKTLMESAKNISERQKQEAEGEIANFEKTLGNNVPNNAAKTLYESAKQSLKKGDGSEKIGDKYEHYLNAAAFAREAKYKQEETSAEAEAGITAAMKKTLDTMEKAKKDGIDTYFEETELKMLADIKEAWVLNRITDSYQGIINKTMMKYGYLEDYRKQLLMKIDAGEGELADLKTDMRKAESDMFNTVGKMVVENGIGNFAQLAKEYQYIDGEIEKGAKTIIENSIGKDITINADIAELDKPINITGTIFVHNKYGMGAKNVRIKIPSIIEFRENELNEGAELVSAANYETGNFVVYLKEVRPYEKLLLQLNKNIMAVITTKNETKSIGNPDGSADVEEKITFEAAYDLNGIHVPEYFESWAIDGKKNGGIAKGSHSLYGKYRIQHAFEYSKGDIKAITEGLNSEVSYDIVISPKIDIDNALILIQEGDIDYASSLTVSAYSAGITLKNKKSIGNGIYGFEIENLEKGMNITIRVGYTISKAAEYAKTQINQMRTESQSEETKKLIDAAEIALNGNDTRRAVENIEKARQLIEHEIDLAAKEQSKLAQQKEKIQAEKQELFGALAIAEAANLTTTVARLHARQEIIDAALDSKTTSEIDGFDYGWEKKEALAKRKELSTAYAKLKQDYLMTNDGNASENEFSDFEAAITKLEISGRLEDALEAEKKLGKLKEIIDMKGADSKAEYQAVIDQANFVKSRIANMMARYAKEYEDAKGSQLFALFNYDYKSVQRDTKALDNLLAKKERKETITDSNTALNKAAESMNQTLEYLRKESARKLDSIKNIYAAKKDGLSEKERKLAEQGMLKFEEEFNKTNYANAIITGDAILKIIGKKSDDNNGMVILGLTALLVIGAIIIYLMKGGSGKNKKMPRKLKSVDDQ